MNGDAIRPDQGKKKVTHKQRLVEEAEKIFRSIAIPSPPRVLMQLNEEMGKAEPEYRVITDLVSQDLAMTAKVLRIANSPYFGVRNRIKSIATALSVLGLEHFRNIVLASAFRDGMKNKNSTTKIGGQQWDFPH